MMMGGGADPTEEARGRTEERLKERTLKLVSVVLSFDIFWEFIMFKKGRMSSNSGDTLRKYDTISLEDRKTLVRLVVEEERSISKSAKRLGIKLSTAKLIIKKYKDSGNFFERKSDRERRERDELKGLEQNRNDIQGQSNNALPLETPPTYPSYCSFPVQQYPQAAQQYSLPFFPTDPAFLIYPCHPQQLFWL